MYRRADGRATQNAGVARLAGARVLAVAVGKACAVVQTPGHRQYESLFRHPLSFSLTHTRSISYYLTLFLSLSLSHSLTLSLSLSLSLFMSLGTYGVGLQTLVSMLQIAPV